MNALDWKLVDGFSEKEKWGDSKQMDTTLLWLLSEIRRKFRNQYDINATFSIHCGYESDGHKKTGFHPRGMATDFHINCNRKFWEQVDILEEMFAKLEINQFIGFGIYPNWNSPGFHLDTRLEIGRWGRLESHKGEYLSDIDIAVPEDGYVKLKHAYEYAKIRGI
jgi:hypothetical protein